MLSVDQVQAATGWWRRFFGTGPFCRCEAAVTFGFLIFHILGLHWFRSGLDAKRDMPRATGGLVNPRQTLNATDELMAPSLEEADNIIAGIDFCGSEALRAAA